MGRSSNTENSPQSDLRRTKGVFHFPWRRSPKRVEASSPPPITRLSSSETTASPTDVSRTTLISTTETDHDSLTKRRPTPVPISEKGLPKDDKFPPPSRKLSHFAEGNRKTEKDHDKLEESIAKLNRSVTQLYKTIALLQGDLQPEDWSKQPNLKPLDVQNLDEGTQLVATVTQQLIAKHKRVKEEKDAQKGLLVATERFLKTTGYVISPALKTFLKVVVQGAAVLYFSCHG
jgi:hypothetical protein